MVSWLVSSSWFTVSSLLRTLSVVDELLSSTCFCFFYIMRKQKTENVSDERDPMQKNKRFPVSHFTKDFKGVVN